MDLELAGKTVLITGGSKGIGLATAKAFAGEGAHVIITARTEETLKAAVQEIDPLGAGSVGSCVADLSKATERDRLFAEYADIDLLVNNAGAIPGGRLGDITMETWEEAWALKVIGYIHLCKLFGAKMVARQSGAIVNVIGSGGRAVRPEYICGAAGNAALIGFTNAFGAETTKDNVRVFGINPSPTLTDRIIGVSKARAKATLGDEGRWAELIDGSKFPFGRLKTPEEVGALIVMLSAPSVQYLSGTVIDMDGGSQWLG